MQPWHQSGRAASFVLVQTHTVQQHLVSAKIHCLLLGMQCIVGPVHTRQGVSPEPARCADMQHSAHGTSHDRQVLTDIIFDIGRGRTRKRRCPGEAHMKPRRAPCVTGLPSANCSSSPSTHLEGDTCTLELGFMNGIIAVIPHMLLSCSSSLDQV
jgi:hypothetical protein